MGASPLRSLSGKAERSDNKSSKPNSSSSGKAERSDNKSSKPNSPSKQIPEAMSENMPQRGRKRLGVQVCKSYALPNFDAFFVVSAGTVLDFEGDAIVNAANPGCISGGGVDGAITAAGGPALAEARRALPYVKKGVRCPTGEAKITIGGDLNNPYCIHAVGPNYWSEMRDGVTSLEDCDNLVRSAYHDSMRRGQEKALQTIGFSLLSAGIFRGDQELKKVLAAGVLGILNGLYLELKEVHMIAFTREEVQDLQDVCEEIFAVDNGVAHQPPSSTLRGQGQPAVKAARTDEKAVESQDEGEVFTNEPPAEALAASALPDAKSSQAPRARQ